jgi:hypothetical protein
MNCVERSDFDKDVRGRWKLAVYEFKVSQRSQERSSTALLFIPSCACGESERREKTEEPEPGIMAFCGAKKRDSLDHA